VRLSKKDYESQRAKMYGPQDLWYHIDCFIAKRDELEFPADMDPTKSVLAFEHVIYRVGGPVKMSRF